MTTPVDLAVAGCSSLVGEALLELLDEASLPLGHVYLLDSEAEAGRKVGFQGRSLTVQPLAEFDFSQAQLALFALPATLAAEFGPQASAAGCRVIDTSDCFRQDSQVPLLMPGVEAAALADLPVGSIIATPSPAAVLLALVLRPLQQAAGLERLDITLCFPASMAGRAGVEELATQTASLLNARSLKTDVFPKQLAFNLLPLVGAAQKDGGSQAEAGLLAELRRLLDPALSLGISIIQVPVFFGLAATLHLQTREPLPAASARQLLQAEAGIKVIDPADEVGYPTPVTEAGQQDEVFLGRLRDDRSRSKSLNFWIVADNVRKCAASNAIQLAERLVRSAR